MAILDFYGAENGLIADNCIFARRGLSWYAYVLFRHKPVGTAVHASTCDLFFRDAAPSE
jgi:hypothetical protein